MSDRPTLDPAAGACDEPASQAGSSTSRALPPHQQARSSGSPCCHDGAAGPVTPGTLVVAMVGAPNVGKSTLFNAITGARRDTGNWPGTSVAVGTGSWRLPGTEVSVVDLPGAYSLDPLSPDEALTRDLLVEAAPADRPDLVLVALDATALSRSLYMLAQVREQPVRVVAVLTMTDIAARRGLAVDPDRLAAATGAPVVALDPRRRACAQELAQVVENTLTAPVRPVRGGASGVTGLLAAAAGPGGAGIRAVRPSDPLDAADERFAWIDAVIGRAVRGGGNHGPTRSDRIDRFATAPITGPLLFLAVMWAVFQITTTVAAPMQEGLGALLDGPITTGVQWALIRIGLGHTLVSRFVLEGLLSGVGMLLTFVPLMALMFGLLALLEDSGYLARAAVVTDRVMRAVGLPGRAFLPLVVGFGCNVPGVSGTRVLPNARHRLLTTLLVPFTSCSARLVVYVLVASIFFPGHVGTVVFVMYVLSILFVVGVGLLLRSTLLRPMPNEPLVLDLPPYHVPVPRLVLRVAWTRVRGFLTTASGIIVGAVAVVWLLQAVPTASGHEFGQVPVGESLFATTARAVAPVFGPAGFGDWHATSALMTGFVAKEAVISSWSQTYAAQQAGASAGSVHAGAATTHGTMAPGQLGQAIRGDFERSSGGHPYAAIWAFLAFLLAYTPCVATLSAQWREIGRRWTGVGVAMQLLLAWTVATAVFQVGRALS